MVISRHGFGFHSLALCTLFFSPTVSEWKKSLFWRHHPERQNYRKHLSLIFCFLVGFHFPTGSIMWFVIVDLWIQAVWSLNSTVFFRQLPGCLMIWICNSNINSVSEQTAAFQFHWILWIQASNAKIHSANQCSSSPKHIQQTSESPQFFHVHLRLYLPTIFQMLWHFTNTSPVF